MPTKYPSSKHSAWGMTLSLRTYSQREKQNCQQLALMRCEQCCNSTCIREVLDADKGVVNSEPGRVGGRKECCAHRFPYTHSFIPPPCELGINTIIFLKLQKRRQKPSGGGGAVAELGRECERSGSRDCALTPGLAYTLARGPLGAGTTKYPDLSPQWALDTSVLNVD